MFQSLRPNSQIYIFHKGDSPRLERGTIVGNPTIRPKYQVPPTFGNTENVVDIVVKLGNQSVNYTNLPPQLDIADSFSNGESIVVSDNREAMNAEILSMKQKSTDIINSIDYHRNLIICCDSILSELNPEYAEKRLQQEEINTLKGQMTDMANKMNELMETNRSLIEKLNKETMQ